jgi:hypothetical protein
MVPRYYFSLSSFEQLSISSLSNDFFSSPEEAMLVRAKNLRPSRLHSEEATMFLSSVKRGITRLWLGTEVSI